MVLAAKDIMEKDFLSLGRETSVVDAAREMKARKRGFAVISSSHGTPEGIVTEWDLLSKVVAEAKDPARVKVSDIMTTNLISVDAGVGFDQVAQLMAQKGVRRLLVFKDDKVLGVITASIVLARLKEYIDKLSAQIARLQSPIV